MKGDKELKCIGQSQPKTAMKGYKSHIILYSPRPKGSAAAGLGNGFNTTKANVFFSQHTVKEQNLLPQDFVGAKNITGLKKN